MVPEQRAPAAGITCYCSQEKSTGLTLEDVHRSPLVAKASMTPSPLVLPETSKTKALPDLCRPWLYLHKMAFPIYRLLSVSSQVGITSEKPFQALCLSLMNTYLKSTCLSHPCCPPPTPPQREQFVFSSYWTPRTTPLGDERIFKWTDRHIVTLVGAGENLSVKGYTCVLTAMFLRPQVLWGQARPEPSQSWV